MFVAAPYGLYGFDAGTLRESGETVPVVGS
jgi:hypothetical protein